MKKALERILDIIDMKCIFLILIGSFIQALGISNIHAYSDVTEGGSIGLTLLVHHWWGISPAISSIFINAGCYILGWKVMGKKFLFYSVISVGFYSICYGLIEPFTPLYPQILSSSLACAIVGAMFIGVGVGISVLGGAATCGDDALAMSLSRKLNCKIEYIYLISDLSVLLISLSYIPLQKIMYSLLTVVLSGQIIGLIQKIDIRK